MRRLPCRSGRFPVSLALILLMSLGHTGAAASDTNGVPLDWIAVHADTVFSMMAPPGTRFVRANGIDSFTGSLVGPDFELSFDYGLYSSPLTEHASDESYQVERILVQGKKAHIITSYVPGISSDAPYFIGIHFSELEESSQGTMKLTINGSVASNDDYDVVKNAFISIHFGSNSSDR